MYIFTYKDFIKILVYVFVSLEIFFEPTFNKKEIISLTCMFIDMWNRIIFGHEYLGFQLSMYVCLYVFHYFFSK